MKSLAIATAISTCMFFTANAYAQEDLAKKSGCMSCHDATAKKVGPSFKDIAAKYKGNADAEATLVTKLKEGKGHPPVKASEADDKALVKWVLSM